MNNKKSRTTEHNEVHQVDIDFQMAINDWKTNLNFSKVAAAIVDSDKHQFYYVTLT